MHGGFPCLLPACDGVDIDIEFNSYYAKVRTPAAEEKGSDPGMYPGMRSWISLGSDWYLPVLVDKEHYGIVAGWEDLDEKLA